MSEPMEDNLGQANAIMLWRIYDVLIGIYSNINEDEARRLVEAHDDGLFISPPPSYRVEGD